MNGMATIDGKIIDALGGTTAVSRKAETPLSTVHSWRKNSIPASRLAHLKLIAQAEGLVIDWSTGEVLGHAASNTGHGVDGEGGIIHNRSTSAASMPA